MIFESFQSSDIWLILGITLIILEIFNGSLVFFIPSGAGAILIGILYKIQENYLYELFPNWAYALVFWGLLSLVISFLIQRYFKKKKSTEEDVNSY